MSHTIICGLDNGDGTWDTSLPQALVSDSRNHSTLGIEVRHLAGVGNPFYVFHTADLSPQIRANPGTNWDQAIICSSNPSENNDAVQAMMETRPAVQPETGAVIWDANNPPV